jgi:hypothetical protein
MAKSDQDAFYYKVEQLEELVIRQQKALEMANHLLELKDKLVELYEEETELYKQECKKIKRALLVSCIWLIFLATINLIRLLS